MAAPHLQVAAIEGEHGTGKHTLARYLFSRSPLAASAFQRRDAREWLATDADPSTLAGFTYLDRVDLLAPPGQGLLLGVLKIFRTARPAAPSCSPLRKLRCARWPARDFFSPTSLFASPPFASPSLRCASAAKTLPHSRSFSSIASAPATSSARRPRTRHARPPPPALLARQCARARRHSRKRAPPGRQWRHPPLTSPSPTALQPSLGSQFDATFAANSLPTFWLIPGPTPQPAPPQCLTRNPPPAPPTSPSTPSSAIMFSLSSTSTAATSSAPPASSPSAALPSTASSPTKTSSPAQAEKGKNNWPWRQPQEGSLRHSVRPIYAVAPHRRPARQARCARAGLNGLRYPPIPRWLRSPSLFTNRSRTRPRGGS
jgi:hypothetical protein